MLTADNGRFLRLLFLISKRQFISFNNLDTIWRYFLIHYSKLHSQSSCCACPEQKYAE